jgi:hypothetical protein
MSTGLNIKGAVDCMATAKNGLYSQKWNQTLSHKVFNAIQFNSKSQNIRIWDLLGAIHSSFVV